MKNKVLVITKTNMFDGFGTQLFDENPTCDCCFSKLNLEKSKVKKLIEFLVTSDEECKDVVITEVIINNKFIGQELNFGDNNVFTFKEKHVLDTTPINTISTIANAKDEESIKQMCKLLGVDYEEYLEFSKMMDKTLEPMSKENLEKIITEDNLNADNDNIDTYLVDTYVEMVSLFPLKQKESIRVTPLKRGETIKNNLYKFDTQFTVEAKRLFAYCNTFVTKPGKNNFYFTENFVNSQIIGTIFYLNNERFESIKSKFKLVKNITFDENMTEEKSESNTSNSEIYVSPVTLHDGGSYKIVDNNVFKQPLLNILKKFNLTNGKETDDLIILDSIAADIRVVAELIFKVTSSKSITVIYFGDYYYISCNKSFKEITHQEKNNIDTILGRYQSAELYILNK